MLRRWLFVGLVVLASVVPAVGCGVPQREHDATLAERDAAEAEAASVSSELATAKADLAIVARDLEETESGLAVAEIQLLSLQSQVSSLQGQLAGSEARAAKLKEQIRALEGNQVGNLSPDFQLKDLDGKTVSLRDLLGRPVILNFWASWCGPCRSEMPYLQQAHEKWRDKGLVVLTINQRENTSTVRQFMQDGGFSLPVLLDANGDVGATYSITAIPTTFFIAEYGLIRERRLGSFPSLEAIESSLSKIMAVRDMPPLPPELALYTPSIDGLKVTINGVTMPGTPGATITRIHWDWGDGSLEDHWFPASHSYKAGGSYTVKATSYQSSGPSITKSVTVQVIQ